MIESDNQDSLGNVEGMMSIKGSFAAALIAVTLAFSPVSVEAKTSVHIGIGIGVPDDCYGGPWGRPCVSRYYDDFRYYYRDYPYNYYDQRRHSYRRDFRLSCGEARELLRERGYRRISSRDCGGGTYVFTALKRGHFYRIAVRARNGAVLSVERI